MFSWVSNVFLLPFAPITLSPPTPTEPWEMVFLMEVEGSFVVKRAKQKAPRGTGETVSVLKAPWGQFGSQTQSLGYGGDRPWPVELSGT